MSLLPEFKVRYIVNELAKDIVEIDDILAHLGISHEEYIKLSTTRAFKEALVAANTEWQGATNTVKRVKLKAAAITEELMLKIFLTARDTNESLSAKTKAFEAISKIAGLGALEPSAATGGVLGNVFNLQINYSNGPTETMQIGAPVIVTEYDSADDSENDEGEDNNGEKNNDENDVDYSGSNGEVESTVHESIIHELPPISQVFASQFEEL
jgi:hypothetical protein